MDTFDVAVVGAGVAGLTAAATTASCGLKTIVTESLAAGGQISTVENIRNFPGSPQALAGCDLGPRLQQQAEQCGVSFLLDSAVALEPDGRDYRLACAHGCVRAAAVIIAAGSRRRTLGIPGEREFEGRGVSHCAACDAPLFKGSSVVVIGAGDSAFDESELLAEHAAEVTIAHSGDRPRARQQAVARIAALSNVRVVGGAKILAIEGDTGVTAVTVLIAQRQQRWPCTGVFIYVGLEPNSAFLGSLVEMDSAGHIITDLMMRTSRPGLFAAGDIRSQAAGLLASAVGDGATAAVAAARYLTTRGQA